MTPRIRNIDTLEKEMYRLRLRAKNYEDELEKNLGHLEKNYFPMAINSILNRTAEIGTGKEKIKEKPFHPFWDNEDVRNGIDKIVSHLTDWVSEGIINLMDKILRRKN